MSVEEEQARYDAMIAEQILVTDFGAKLFNLYTQERPTGARLFFSQRNATVKAMLVAMLKAEREAKR